MNNKKQNKKTKKQTNKYTHSNRNTLRNIAQFLPALISWRKIESRERLVNSLLSESMTGQGKPYKHWNLKKNKNKKNKQQNTCMLFKGKGSMNTGFQNAMMLSGANQKLKHVDTLTNP